jgi:hypothetical protein
MSTRSKFAGALAGLALAVPAAALAQSGGTQSGKTEPKADKARIEIGYLECSLVNKSGNIIKSNESFSCTFDPAGDGMANQVYTASVTNWGFDLSSVKEKTMRWGVLSTTEKHDVGALQGDYGGISADVAAGLGVGVNAMVGGSGDSFTLQPVSVSTQEGVGIAAGVKTMNLTYVGPKS